VILAVGGQAGLRREPHPRVVYAGDLADGPTSVVEALASGKRAGHAVHQLLGGGDPACPDRGSCPEGGGACPKRATCPEWNRPATPDRPAGGARVAAGLPVPLDCDVLGRRLPSPFLLAASAFTESYAQVRRAYEAGWAGALMTPAHGEAGPGPPDRLREDAERLRREFPDRLTLSAPEGAAIGDPSDYRAAAELLARGAQAVLVDTLVRSHGLGVVNELQRGLSCLLAERGLRSVSELVGSAPRVASSAPLGKAVCVVEPALCTGCGNCSRCPHLAIALDASGIPAVDPARCAGCGRCVEQCLPGAIAIRATGVRAESSG
jgi:Pyruvate/2-oxoacid:ferredoxin oxidoreductase delta subunit